jgi:fructose/tagatose bisphosphate aldolase
MNTAIRVHSAADACAALRAAASLNLPVTLISAPAAAGYAGASYFAALIALARAEVPDVAVTEVLDCGEAPGHVLGALRQGLKRVRFCGDRDTAAKLAAIAKAQDATVITEDVPALDLARVEDAEAACRTWLKRTADV